MPIQWALGTAVFSVVLGLVSACHILNLSDESFGGTFLHLLHAIAIYEGSGGGHFLIDQSKFPYRCDDAAGGGFHDFFNYTGVMAWSPKKQAAVEAEEQQACKTVDYLAVDHQVALLGATWDELDSIALRRIWQLTPGAQKEVDAALRDLKKLERPTIAFHVRGGDAIGDDDELLFSEAPASKGKDLLDTFQATYPDLKGGTCMFIGDDHQLIDDTAALSQKRLDCKVYKRKTYHKETGYFQAEFNQESTTQRCQAAMHLLADMELMARADYFVGSFDANLPHIIQTMRFGLYLKDRRTFVDASAQHRDWYEVVRQYFRGQEEAPPALSQPRPGKDKSGTAKKRSKGL